jgi:Transmembrane domain of unknown function (DUF3566)
LSRRESREKRPNWRVEPEAASASGGHLAPEVDATGPLLDPLVDPLPLPESPRSKTPGRARERFDQRVSRAQVPETTETVPFEPQPQPRAQRRPRRRVRPAARRVKRTIRRVDPLSVLKLSLFYYACFLIVWLGFVAVLFWVVQSMGLFDVIESVSEGFALEWGKIDISLWLVERWAFVIGLVLVLLGALINAFLAFLYNVGSDLVGGVDVTFVERDV